MREDMLNMRPIAPMENMFMSQEKGLPQATLGRTGLEVTKLGYGAMEVRGNRIWGGQSRPAASGHLR